MNFKEYVESCKYILKTFPETAGYLVVSSEDDEGNGFGEVFFNPTIGEYKDGEFRSLGDDEIDDSDFPDTFRGSEFKANSVCIN